jgi:hypothetical protein
VTFVKAYNLLASISWNPKKPSPIHYVIGKENGDLTSFAAYIMQLISSHWFEHGDVLILDNVAVHSGGDAGNVQDYLWDMVVDGRPLNILVIFLPTQSPELNPIELVFHILARHISSLGIAWLALAILLSFAKQPRFWMRHPMKPF